MVYLLCFLVLGREELMTSLELSSVQGCLIVVLVYLNCLRGDFIILHRKFF